MLAAPNAGPAPARPDRCEAGRATPRIIPSMSRDEVQRRLSENREELAALGVRDLFLFGSVARGEARVDSDVDLLVEFDRAVGLFQFFRVQQRLSELLGRPVDLVMKDAIKPQLRARILAEAVRAA